VKKSPFKGHYEGQKFINALKNQQMAPKFSGHFSCGSAINEDFATKKGILVPKSAL
jgi:hypothetical protein